MENKVAIQNMNNEQIALIKRTFAKNATDDELNLFIHICNRSDLDPAMGEIFFVKYKSKKPPYIETMSIITGIKGYRSIAERSGAYAGSDEAIFDSEEGPHPKKATVSVYKMVAGQRCKFTASARWLEFYPGDFKPGKWKEMPYHMLEKCAEALALRKAFPKDLRGIYVEDEIKEPEEPVQISKEEVKERIDNIANKEPPKKVLYDEKIKEHFESLKNSLVTMKYSPNDIQIISTMMQGRLASELKMCLDEFNADKQAASFDEVKL